MTSLTSRARGALTAREHSRAAAELARADRRAESRRRDLDRAAASLATLLGVDPAQVTATDDPDRRYYGYPYGTVPGCRHRLLDHFTPTASCTTALPPEPDPTPQPPLRNTCNPAAASAQSGEV